MTDGPLVPTDGGGFTERFRAYFERSAAVQAAASLGEGVQIEMHVGEEVFTFSKSEGKNVVIDGPADGPELTFTLTPSAAQAVLDETSEDLATIGIGIMKLVASTDANRRVSVKFHVGFLKLWSKGYFGVLKSGGSQFAQHLASLGLSGMDAIKAALGKLRS